MKNFKKTVKAFSLAELMIVMLVLTIILSATMPILSKRAKVKAAAAASSNNHGNICVKQVNDTLTATIKGAVLLQYYLTGGGGGGGYFNYAYHYSDPTYPQDMIYYAAGGDGGYTSITVTPTGGGTALKDLAGGGLAGCGDNTSGAPGCDVYTSSYPYTYARGPMALPGGTKSGTFVLTPSKTYTLDIKAGGGGGGAGGTSQKSSNFYGGGQGVNDGDYNITTHTGTAHRTVFTQVPGSSTEQNSLFECKDPESAAAGGGPGGNSACKFSQNGGGGGHAGTSSGPGNAGGYAGGGGGYGGKGGDGGIGTAGQPGQSSTSTPGDGAAGASSIGAALKQLLGGYAGTYPVDTAPTGGHGGSAVIYFITTESTCPW